MSTKSPINADTIFEVLKAQDNLRQEITTAWLEAQYWAGMVPGEPLPELKRRMQLAMRDFALACLRDKEKKR